MLSPGASPLVYSVNNLINGKMNFDCSTVKSGDTTPCVSNAGISKFQFQTNKTHRLRLVNSGSEGVQRFSIDNHIMTVIANDFVPVQPYNTTVVTLGVGQRSDVLVTANAGGPESSFWMRSNITSCSLTNQPYAVAAVYYDQANTNSTPSSKSWDVSDPGTCTNDDLSTTIPLYAIPVTTPNTTKVMDVNIYTNGSNVDLWKFDNVSNRVDYNNPVLPMANQGNFSFPEATNVINFAGNQSIRILVNNSSPSSYVPPHSGVLFSSRTCADRTNADTQCISTDTITKFWPRDPATGTAQSSARTIRSAATRRWCGPMGTCCCSSTAIPASGFSTATLPGTLRPGSWPFSSSTRTMPSRICRSRRR